MKGNLLGVTAGKTTLALLIITFVIITTYRMGFFNISEDIRRGSYPAAITEISAGQVTQYLDSQNTSIFCTVERTSQKNLCGISIGLGSEGMENGLDLSKYQSIALSFRFKSAFKGSKVRVSLRNFDPTYSQKGDFSSLKYNTVIFTNETETYSTTIPLNAFQVENWWLEKYQISFSNSKPELTNVAFIEFTSDELKAIGDYQFQILEVRLDGVLFSEVELFQRILLLWLLVFVVFSWVQRRALERMSFKDSLTGIYSRRGALRWLEKKSLDGATIYYLDVDDLKAINDSYGHVMGDKILVYIASTIKQYLSRYEYSSYCFFRVSSDEFAIIKQFESTSIENTEKIAGELLALFSSSFIDEHYAIQFSLSAGVAVANSSQEGFQSLYQKSDMALKQAKVNGKDQYVFFDQALLDSFILRTDILENLKCSLAEQELQLVYMPIVNAQTAKVNSVEVLLRSSNSLLNDIGVETFVTVAEESDFIYQLDLFVIESTFRCMFTERQFVEKTR